jgi:hypothetical protein
MLSYFLLILGSLLLVGCLVIFWRLTGDYKRHVRCYIHYLQDYRMNISLSQYKEQQENLKDIKNKYKLLAGCLVVFMIFCASIITLSIINIKQGVLAILNPVYTPLRVIQMTSLVVGAFYVAIINYKKYQPIRKS